MKKSKEFVMFGYALVAIGAAGIVYSAGMAGIAGLFLIAAGAWISSA